MHLVPNAIGSKIDILEIWEKIESVEMIGKDIKKRAVDLLATCCPSVFKNNQQALDEKIKIYEILIII